MDWNGPGRATAGMPRRLVRREREAAKLDGVAVVLHPASGRLAVPYVALSTSSSPGSQANLIHKDVCIFGHGQAILRAFHARQFFRAQ